MARVVCWFSCGTASAVATKLVLTSNDQRKDGREILIARNHLKEEHPDNGRFARDCERWFGQPIVSVTNKEFDGSVIAVQNKVRFMKNESGAPCTRILKKDMRKAFQRPDDIHVFGYTVDEQDRLDKILDGEPELNIWPILIERNMTKGDCHRIVAAAGIEQAAMYRLGYNNNNCIGCVKGAMGYWNKIRVDFPDVFAETARRERLFGYALNKKEIRKDGRRVGVPIFLDQLDPEDGNYKTEPSIECGILCEWNKPTPATEGE